MSSLWRENKGLELCHSCSRAIEESRKGKTRCFKCARRDAKATAERRARRKLARP